MKAKKCDEGNLIKLMAKNNTQNNVNSRLNKINSRHSKENHGGKTNACPRDGKTGFGPAQFQQHGIYMQIARGGQIFPRPQYHFHSCNV